MVQRVDEGRKAFLRHGSQHLQFRGDLCGVKRSRNPLAAYVADGGQQPVAGKRERRVEIAADLPRGPVTHAHLDALERELLRRQVGLLDFHRH